MHTSSTTRPLRVLFVCTGNSARSQMAEAMLNPKGRGRRHAESAGSQPAAQVNPHAVAALATHGYEWTGHPPRGLESVTDQAWDFVITVCDRAKAACPMLPGQPVIVQLGHARSGRGGRERRGPAARF